MHWLASNSWRCYFRVLTLKLSLAPLHWSQSTLNVVYRVLSDQQPSRPTPGWWWRTVHVLRSRRCLIITAHLLIRATEPGVFDKCFSPSQSVQKKEGGEKSDQTWLVITIIVPSLQSDPTTFISMHILHQTEQLHVWARPRRALQLEASRLQIPSS